PEPRREHSSAERPRPRSILIVDDNVDSARSMAELLKHFGHIVQVVHDGPAALESAVGSTPDVVLLDIGLPGMDGLEVANRMRQMRSLRKTLIIAMTGYGQVEDRRRSHEAGFNAHLVKPVSLETLNELLLHPELTEVAPA